MEGEVFTYAHDQLGHMGFDRTYQRISTKFYIFNIGKKLRSFLYHCHQCRVSSTPRHMPHGSLRPIPAPPYLFHTITIDFILALPRSTPDLFDCTLTVTDKLSKSITIIPGKVNWSASQWRNALIRHLLFILWGVPRAIISDRDRKFVSEVWRGMMDKLGVKFTVQHCLASTNRLGKAKWPRTITHITTALSNSTSQGTGVMATMVMYGARIKEPLDIASDAIVELLDVPRQPALPREVAEPVYPVKPANDCKYKPALIEAIDAIKFASMFMKRRYDKKHKPVFFKVGDFVSLRLHRGYNIPGFSERNTKIEQQFSGPFRIIEKIGRLAYRLELPPAMKIHPVISVAHLEPAPNPSADTFERPVARNLLLNPDLVPDKILRMRTLQRRNGGHMTEFLIRFRGRTAEWDQWLLDRKVPIELRTAYLRDQTE
ncbi:Transposon Ty3-G Gag-Pol polyprotein [Golovinomyces cichoracearum]|uniref:Transposon Ty3-G Gag-Pol polyprotein n=1 Tax=Golovinomyces cichoracearum TaxID=62708 RepID=A0A420HSN1_9PEZI|nr:Transposon Ty3-G Gag-Pol polyprotein [Golovinomyces cichoracearum]